MSTREEVLSSLAISPGDFVVEIGGGHNPFPRADVIFEKYPFENVHRSERMRFSAPVLIADATRLPLPKDGCDLLFASHVIEHLPEPDKFLTEARRVARRVYLEFPSAVRELMFAWSFHEWLVEARDGSHLVFYRNDVPQLFEDFFHKNYDFVFDAWAMQRHEALNSHVCIETGRLTWEFGTETAFERILAHRPRGSDKVNAAIPAAVPYTWRQTGDILLQQRLPEILLNRLVLAWRQLKQGRIRPVRKELVARLACLRCGASRLALGAGEIHCECCGAQYTQRKGLFDFDLS